MNGPDPHLVRNLLGPALRNARIAAPGKLRQADIAARLQLMGLDIDRTVVSRIENQQRHLTDIEFLGFLEALRIDFDRLTEFFPNSQLPSPGTKTYPYPEAFPPPAKVAEDSQPPD